MFSVIADTITIVADEWYPYNGKADSAKPGYGIEIAKRVYEDAGHNVKYKVVPWTRAIVSARNGKYNAIIGAFKEDAPDFTFPKEEFGLAQDTFWVKKSSTWQYKGLESLKNIIIGLIKGYSYGKKMDDFFKANKNIVQYTYGNRALKSNIKKLLLGRIDVVLEDYNVFVLKAKELNIADKVKYAGKTGKREKLYIAFSPKLKPSKKYVDIFDKGIQKLKKTGELDKILQKYNVKYWKK